MSEPQSNRWIKSSRSLGSTACVELTREGDAVLLRNSRHPDVVHTFTQAEIGALFDGVRRGEFDHLLDPAD